MKRNGLQKLIEYAKASRYRKVWYRTVTCLAAVVVFVTVYALILPAITMERETLCGNTEHEHTEECYAPTTAELEARVLGCESVHVHTESCGEDCVYADFVLHTHDEFCYDAGEVLMCTLPEIQEHIHDENCYAAEAPVSVASLEEELEEETVPAEEDSEETPEAAEEAVEEVIESETEPEVTEEQPEEESETAEDEEAPEEAEETVEEELTESEHEEASMSVSQPILICEHEEIVAHKHDESCFDGETCVCGQLEVLTHQHDDSCLVDAPEEIILSESEQEQVSVLVALMNVLPQADEVDAKLQEFTDAEDAENQAIYLSALKEQVKAAYSAYSVLNDNQKTKVDAENLLALYEQWGKETILESVTEDKAVVQELSSGDVLVVKAVETEANEETAAEMETDLICAENGDSVQFAFSVNTESYSEESFADGRVKLEFVLPATEEQAVFDLEAMSWMDQSEGFAPVLTTETRVLNDVEVSCQVLTAYKHLKAEDGQAVIPGSFTEQIVVTVKEMEHNSSIAVKISAAMEYGAWDSICTTHGVVEKLVVATKNVTIINPLSEEEQQVFFEQYLEEINVLQNSEMTDEELSAANAALVQKIQESYLKGELSQELFNILYGQLNGEIDLNTIAEPAFGTAWITEREQWLSEYGMHDEIVRDDLDRAVLRTAIKQSNSVMLASEGVTFQPATLENPTVGSNTQIDAVGGTNISEDGIAVSKTIAGTEQENVFDITLQVMTQDIINEVYNEPDMAVVIVMDISNTMKETLSVDSGNTRYNAAMTAAEAFMDQFAEYTGDVSKIGFVAFNTDAHEIFPMQTCETSSKLNTLKKQARDDTGDIIFNYHMSGTNSDDHSRFTNIEAGLKMGYDMLNDASVKNKNKYIIFLSDGFPTTYVKSGYEGYCVYDASHSKSDVCSTGHDGVQFVDKVTGYTCIYGTSYSDTGAIRARQQATAIKNAGVNIFSIGVDIGAQTIKGYERTGLSVIERSAAAHPNNYELGSYEDKDAFKEWLRNGIGSNYYYDSHSTADFTDAFADVFQKIKEMNAESSRLDWIASDPLPDLAEGMGDTVEFIGFYNREEALVMAKELKGNSGEIGTDGLCENTAVFDDATSTITWDVKNSGYYAMGDPSNRNYVATLKYRVRLRNEDTAYFKEGVVYPTNDTTTLSYRKILVTEINGEQTKYISDQKEINFPLPAVHGYLGELEFQKVDSMERAVANAEFTLSHDVENCSICRGNSTAIDKIASTVTTVNIPDQVKTSGSDGMIAFYKIPSGHKYILEETKVPDGYAHNGNSYTVDVAYDVVTVTVKDNDGNTVAWNEKIHNHTYYELPETGGHGTAMYTFGGLALLGAACLMYNLRGKEDRDK